MEISNEISNEDLNAKLNQFTSEYVSPLNKVSWDSQKQKNVLEILIELLKHPDRQDCHVQAKILQAIKIFTRNKPLLESVVDLEFLDHLLSKSGLKVDDGKTRQNLNTEKIEVILEAQRCLSNIYLQCSRAQDFALENDTLPGILQQTTKYNESQVSSQIISFDMKILFLVTATRPEARTVVVVEHRALSRLTDILNIILERTKESGQSNFPEGELIVSLDVLKALFNLTCYLDNHTCDEEENSLLVKLCQIIQTLIITPVSTGDKKFELVGNCVNLLTNYKGEWTNPLIEPIDKEFVGNDLKEIEYDGSNMNAPQILLDYLDHNLNKIDGNKAHGSLKESLAPILKVLMTLSLTHKKIRKYYKNQILPPLRDLSKRPEEGNTMRNKLCRLLTTPDTTVGSMIAEFMFILCKEKVGRFVKHTGYGNAAGLLARRGLMMGGRGENTYSDTDTDSDTEEYVSNAHKINPVTGHVEPPKVSPFEGMTEEQKEYEANRLANLIHKLSDLGAVSPGRIGPEGTPVPLDHVLQLVEDENNIGELRESEEDSD